MKILHKNLLNIASLVLLAGAGCTQPAVTSLDTNNANEAAVNATTTNVNEVVVENTNAVLENADTTTGDAQDGDGESIDTSDWLTYTNEEYGFELMYPNDWKAIEKGNNVNFFNSSKISELETDPFTSADLYLKIDEKITDPIQELYSDKTSYRLVSDDDGKVVVAYEETNEFANSISTYYFIQKADQTLTLSATFFQNSLQSDTVVEIIETVNFSS